MGTAPCCGPGRLIAARRPTALETADEEEAEVKGAAVRGGRGKGKPVSPFVAPDAHAGPASSVGGGAAGQGAGILIARKLGMSRVATRKYALAESPPPNYSAPRSVPRRRLWPHH